MIVGGVVADAGAGAVLLHEIGGVGHRLHAARDDDVGAAGGEAVGGHHRRLHAGAAHLVDRHRLGRFGEAGAERGLAGGGLAETGGEDTAHVAAVDIVGGNASALDRDRKSTRL